MATLTDGMVIQIDAKAFPAGEPTVSLKQEMVHSPSGIERMRVSLEMNGKMRQSSYTAYEEEIRQIGAAVKTKDVDFRVLYPDATAATHLTFLTNNSLMGPRITAFDFPEGSGPELAYGGGIRTYRIALEAEYDIHDTASCNVIEFQETLTLSGGQKAYAMANTEGDPVILLARRKSLYRATQKGFAVGRSTRPEPPPALWPKLRVDQNPLAKPSPEVLSVSASGIAVYAQRYRIEWEYEFASAVDSFAGGAPHVWTT